MQGWSSYFLKANFGGLDDPHYPLNTRFINFPYGFFFRRNLPIYAVNMKTSLILTNLQTCKHFEMVGAPSTSNFKEKLMASQVFYPMGSSSNDPQLTKFLSHLLLFG
jgi:hypothetical protein